MRRLYTLYSITRRKLCTPPATAAVSTNSVSLFSKVHWPRKKLVNADDGVDYDDDGDEGDGHESKSMTSE